MFNTKRMICVVTVLILLAMVFSGCRLNSRPEPEQSTPVSVGAIPELTSASLSSSTWSSPNGATVSLTAIPSAYVEGQSATFVVRLNDADVVSRPCDWDGTSFTAAVDLNAANGYCYYVQLRNPDGGSNEITVNSPSSVTNEPLINLEDALNAYCSASVIDYTFSGDTLTLTSGSVEVQAPRIINGGQEIRCQDAQLVLKRYDQELGRATVSLTAGAAQGQWTGSLMDIPFTLPALKDDQQLDLTAEVVLTNGQILTTHIATWFYMGGEVVSSVG